MYIKECWLSPRRKKTCQRISFVLWKNKTSLSAKHDLQGKKKKISREGYEVISTIQLRIEEYLN